MTGILPVKQFGEHSTLNMFREYSILDSADISDCFGFTEKEVKDFCLRFNANFNLMQEWYDDYHLIWDNYGNSYEYSIYSPNSIVESLSRGRFDGYWNKTETFEALQKFITWNLDGFKEAIISLLAGKSVEISNRTFQNDMFSFRNKSEILTLLVHLGYLTFNQRNQSVSIPNKEVSKEFVDSIEASPYYSETFEAIKASKTLLEALWNKDAERVAEGIEKAHLNFDSIPYNNENSLSCVIELAFYYAKEYYISLRELPTGKGFADICFIPKPTHPNKPAVLIEL